MVYGMADEDADTQIESGIKYYSHKRDVEDKILKIAKQIQTQRTQDLTVYGEIMLACEKLSDGITDDEIVSQSSIFKKDYTSTSILRCSLYLK